MPGDGTITRNQFYKPLTWRATADGGTTWDGIPRTIKNSLEMKLGNRDLIVVRDAVMFLAAAVIALNFVVDVLYAEIGRAHV